MEEGLENFVPLIQKSRGYDELKKDVIDSGICSGCGACAAFCDRVNLTEDGSVPASWFSARLRLQHANWRHKMQYRWNLLRLLPPCVI
jgi:coenzyme F420-reducing hydrogenase gamma subunit